MAVLVVPSLILYFIFAGSYRHFRFSEWRRLILPAFGFLAGFSIYLIQFIRMSRNFPLDQILGPVMGSTFISQLGTFSPILLGESLLSYLFFLTVQFGPIGLILGGLGVRQVFRDKDFSLRKIIAFFIAFALFGIFYRVTDQFTFFITSYVFWVLLMGIGSLYAWNLIPEKRRFLLPRRARRAADRHSVFLQCPAASGGRLWPER